MTKVFLTGASGYIGGDALYTLYKAHPEFSYTILVRDATKNDIFKAAFPKVRIVNGGLDDYELLKKEAADADIVVHTADSSDHVVAAQAIADGLAEGHTAAKPGYWLHTGGTGILTYADSDRGVFGEYSDKVYNDWEGVDELTHLPDHAFHRNVDIMVLEAAAKNADKVKVALLCPPTIYGTGRGLIHKKSRQVYSLASLALEINKAPYLGSGKAIWNNVHLYDLSDLYVLFAEAAVAGKNDEGLWGPNAYYLVENGEHAWGDVSRSIATIAAKEGYIPAPVAEEIDPETCKKFAGFEGLSWGLNSRGTAIRAKKLLGWKPVGPTLDEELPGIVKMMHDAKLKK